VKKNKVRKIVPKIQEANILEWLKDLYSWRFFSLAISLLYMGVMLYFALTLHKVGGFDVETDFYAGYAPQAKDFMAGRIVIDSYHGPLYPWLLGLCGKIIGNLFTTGVLISVISASVSLYLIFEIFKSVSSTDVAFLTVLLTAVNTTFIYYSYSAGTDMLFVMLSLAGVFILFRKSEVSVIDLCLSAVVMALVYLVRYNGLIFLIAVPFVILFGAVQTKGVNKYVAAAIWAGVFLVVIIPWSVYLKINRGSFFYNANYQNMAFEIFGGGYENWDKFWFTLANKYTSYWDVFSAAPLLFVETVSSNIYSHLVGDIGKLNNYLVGGLSVLGAVLFAFSHPSRRRTGLVVIFISFFCVLLTVFYTERFSLFLLPIYSFLASYLIKSVFEKFRLKMSALILVNFVAVAAVIMTSVDSYSFNSRAIRWGAYDMIPTGEWFHKKFGSMYDNEKITARKPHIAYLLNMRFYPFPMVDNYDSLISNLRRDSVKFLYYGTFEASDRPQFYRLLNDSLNPGLKFLCVVRNSAGIIAKLYEVTK